MQSLEIELAEKSKEACTYADRIQQQEMDIETLNKKLEEVETVNCNLKGQLDVLIVKDDVWKQLEVGNRALKSELEEINPGLDRMVKEKQGLEEELQVSLNKVRFMSERVFLLNCIALN